jgi:hypothetical protein
MLARKRGENPCIPHFGREARTLTGKINTKNQYKKIELSISRFERGAQSWGQAGPENHSSVDMRRRSSEIHSHGHCCLAQINISPLIHQ